MHIGQVILNFLSQDYLKFYRLYADEGDTFTVHRNLALTHGILCR